MRGRVTWGTGRRYNRGGRAGFSAPEGLSRMPKDRPADAGRHDSHDDAEDASDARPTAHMPDAKVDIPRIERAVREILLAVGEDPDREGLLKTPNRVARAYGELMAGLQDDPRAASEDRLQRAIRRGRAAAGHRVPLAVRAPPAAVHRAVHVAYLPDGKVVGLSKLARLVEGYARRPQVQERLTTQIADALMDELSPIGAACVIEATHTCMTIRGAKKHGSTMVTSGLRGIFKENPVQPGGDPRLMHVEMGGSRFVGG